MFTFSSPTIVSHECSAEELGLMGNAPTFWPIYESHEVYLDAFRSSLLCPDRSNLAVQGGLYSLHGSQILIDILKCVGRDYCKSEEQIREYFAHRQIVILSN